MEEELEVVALESLVVVLLGLLDREVNETAPLERCFDLSDAHKFPELFHLEQVHMVVVGVAEELAEVVFTLDVLESRLLP